MQETASAASIPMITVEYYRPDFKEEWDHCVLKARNGVFWLLRNYLDYHGNRFEDRSMLFRNASGRVLAILPAHSENETLRSHGGLPFCGLLVGPRCFLHTTEAIFALVAQEMQTNGWRRLLYTPTPHPYARWPQEEAVYLLQKMGARITDIRLTAMIHLRGQPMTAFISRDRRWRIKTAEKKYPYLFAEETDFALVWPDLEAFTVGLYGRKPVHSLEEITRLQTSFPKEIKLLVARQGGKLIGGQVVFLFDRVMRCQYSFRSIAPSDDYLSLRLKVEACSRKEWTRDWLDLSTSVDVATGEIKPSLYQYKESSGCRGVCVPTWEWEPQAQ